jgi:hypothetical protein
MIPTSRFVLVRVQLLSRLDVHVSERFCVQIPAEHLQRLGSLRYEMPSPRKHPESTLSIFQYDNVLNKVSDEQNESVRDDAL